MIDSGEPYKLVDFDRYCPTCKYKDLKENEDPCDECLAMGANLYSHKPVKYEKKERSRKN